MRSRIATTTLAAFLILSTPSPVTSPATAHARHHKGFVRLIAWSTKGLPADAGRALNRMSGVRATTVLAGAVFMKRSFGPAGHIVDRPPRHYRIPLDVAYVKPRGYRHFVRQRERSKIRSLSHGRALMARGEVDLRSGHARLGLRLTVGRLRSIGRLTNQDAQGYELITPAPAPGPVQTLRTELIRKRPAVPTRRIRRRIASRLQAGDRLRVDTARKAHYLRYADRTASQMEVKRAMSEFPMRFASGSSVRIWSRWVGKHITYAPVPILGHVTCNRTLLPQLRGALRELKRRGLAHLIHRDQYAGCYNARYVTGGHQRLSRHAWGAALDINTSGNCFGCTPHQDPRLVRIMHRWGFFWGGRFPTPDGMHFEWRRFPK